MQHFPEFHPQSRVWIYQPSRPLTDADKNYIFETGAAFAKNWTAHNLQLKAAIDILYGFFVIIIVDKTMTDVSGCGIDKSVHFMQDTGATLGIDFFDRLNIAYLKNETIQITRQSELKKLLAEGEMRPDTPVFINSIQALAELNQHWPMPIGESYLGIVSNSHLHI